MRFPGPTSAGEFNFGIDTKHDLGDLPPVCAVRLGVQQSKIGHQVLHIVAGQSLRRGCKIGDFGIERERPANGFLLCEGVSAVSVAG